MGKIPLDTQANERRLSLGGLLRAGAILVVVVASFVGALVYRSGGVAQLVRPASEPVRAGAFVFEYPDRWARMPKAKLPAMAGTSVKGAVVAGLCPAGAPGKAGCAADVDVTYVLFQAGESAFPSDVAGLIPAFDASFPKRFERFELSSASTHLTADGMRYLRYEFSFGPKHARTHEIVAAYRADDGGVIVVASGPESQFDGHRDSVLSILDGARVASRP